VPEPIRILRVIARLNMGGPAIHVSNLAAGLETRGYHTTLVAGSLARGEDSMAFVAERLGVSVVSVPEIQREVAPLHDARSVRRLTAIIREERPHILHTHTAKAGALARAAALAAGRARPPIIVHTFHGHVLKGYFGPGRTAFFKQVERSLARYSDVLVAVSPEVRDELVEHGIAPAEKFTVIRLGIPLDERLGDETADLDYRGLYGIPADAFVVGWVARRASAAFLPSSAWSATAPTASGWSRSRTNWASRAPRTSSATSPTSPATTGCSTRSCSLP